MTKSKPATGAQRLVSEIQLMRLRLAKAESSLESAREQARVAKRKRKEAKQAARRARKQLKQAKADRQAAKKVLSAAEEKLALAHKRAALARKRAQAPKTVKASSAQSGQRKKAAPRRRCRPVSLATATPASAGATQGISVPPDVGRPLDATTSPPEDPSPATDGHPLESSQPEPATAAEASPADTPAP